MLGSRFKEYRIEKHLSLKFVANGIVSESALSRFENGKADVPATRLFQLLDRMSVSKSEFADAVEMSSGRADNYESMVASAYSKKNTELLAKLCLSSIKQFREFHAKSDLFNAATAANYYCAINGKNILRQYDIDCIFSEISGTMLWTNIELKRFGNCVLLLLPKQVLSISLLLCDSVGEIRKHNYVAYIDAWVVLMNAVYSLILRDQVSARVLMERLKGIFIPQNMVLTHFRLTFNEYLLKQAEGKDMQRLCYQIIFVLQQVGAVDLSDEFMASFKKVRLMSNVR